MTVLHPIAIAGRLLPVLLLGVLAAAAAAAPPLVLDDGHRLSGRWQFLNGGEFPGARGGLRAVPAGLELAYDFAHGGQYVAASRNLAVAGRPAAFTFRVTPAQDCTVFCRAIDANGRTFQRAAAPLKGGAETVLELPLAGPWSGSWGGQENSPMLTLPIRTICIGIEKGSGRELRGTVTIRDVTATGDGLAAGGAAGEPFVLEAQGWHLAGAWLGPADAPALVVRATPPPAPGAAVPAAAELTVSMPTGARPFTRRFRFAGTAPAEAVFEPFLPDGVNPRNVYPVTVILNTGTCELRTTCRLTGALAADTNLGIPKNSKQIKKLPFGTCAHLSYGQNPDGAFAGWSDWRRLIDAMAACGFQWIRDGVFLEPDAAGNLRVRPYDLQWIRYAREKGLRTIVFIEFEAAQPAAVLVARTLAVARDTRGLVDVFELGNEPNNFGGWMPKYGGTWNGREPDNSTSPWVREFVKTTNTVADALRRARPDARIIGLGACAPTNFRMLDLGVSKSLDGVVEHPYPFSLPPEKVPYGWALEARDGVRIGDAEGTFAGLIQSYAAHFRKTGVPRTLWVTEFGFTTYRFNGANEKGLYGGYREEAQAVYLVRRFIQSLALPAIAVSCQYDFIDDYNSMPGEAEANFGLLRGDFSPKPAYFAIQRMNSLLDACAPDPAAGVTVLDAPLHRAMTRGELVRDWDKVTMTASNTVMAFPFANPAAPKERLLAVWSAQPVDGEFNCRAATLAVAGWARFGQVPAVGIDLVTGDTFDVPVKTVDGRLVVEKLSLGTHPILIKLFRP